jgi:hypothetical protein
MNRYIAQGLVMASASKVKEEQDRPCEKRNRENDSGEKKKTDSQHLIEIKLSPNTRDGRMRARGTQSFPLDNLVPTDLTTSSSNGPSISTR